MNIFEKNEKLKDEMILTYKAWEAKSKYFNQGVMIIPEPFLETVVRWDKDSDQDLIKKAINKILDFRDEMDKRCFVTDVQYETCYGHPQVVYAIFKDDEDIFNVGDK
jgi:hypothetical protein